MGKTVEAYVLTGTVVTEAGRFGPGQQVKVDQAEYQYLSDRGILGPAPDTVVTVPGSATVSAETDDTGPSVTVVTEEASS
jgi:hypothetical protein